MMRRLAFIFPGQGAQYVGMGQELAETYPVVMQTLREAEAALGEPLIEVLFRGPAERLTQTYYTQPAILSLSVAIARLATSVVRPFAAAGHSLGEYSALVAAGCLSLEDAVRTVRLRARFMEEAVPPDTGTMAAVMGLEAGQVEAICKAAGGPGIAEPATYNGGRQVVIAGTLEGVETATRLALEAGARRVHQLKVSGPFHSSLLEPAGKRLRDVLQDIRMGPCDIPVYSNVYAKAMRDPDEIAEALVKQVSYPVLWEDTIRALRAEGVTTFVELGPGRVLSGLVRRIDPTAQVLNVEDPASWSKFVAWAEGNEVI
ncbi:MAG: ACP S-malonyltransferase [Limnochordia bacterium]|jgi:[acyl-carrier-protein] S-malonyltransferase